MPAERRCELDVPPGSTGTCMESFVRVKAKDFFDRNEPPGPEDGRRPPRQGDPRLGPPQDRPPPQGRPPPPRGERPPLGGAPRPRDELPRWLVKAAQAFFDGEYERVTEILETKSASDERAVFYVRLLRGATHYTLYLLGGERVPALAAAAVDDLRECRRQRSAFVPHPDFFSPRFIEFFSVSAAP